MGSQRTLGTSWLPGGWRQGGAAQPHQKAPVAIVQLAMDAGCPQAFLEGGPCTVASYPDEDIPQDILKNLVEGLPQPREIPPHLDEYTQEEGWAFWRVGCPLQVIRCRGAEITKNMVTRCRLLPGEFLCLRTGNHCFRKLQSDIL